MKITKALFFSTAIMVCAFIPLFTMTGVEGHIFGPMARTYAYAISGGLIATFTVTPALAGYLLPESLSETDTAAIRFLRRGFRPVSGFATLSQVG